MFSFLQHTQVSDANLSVYFLCVIHFKKRCAMKGKLQMQHHTVHVRQTVSNPNLQYLCMYLLTQVTGAERLSIHLPRPRLHDTVSTGHGGVYTDALETAKTV